MLRFCANLSTLFPELPLGERFAVAAEAGFTAVEIQFPYALGKSTLVELLERHSQELVLFNLPAGNWDDGERGIACDPSRQDEFTAGVQQAISYAKATGCKKINCLAGIIPDHITPSEARQQLLSNLSYAGNQLAEAGVELLIEPINSSDIPGFLLNRTKDAIALINACDKTRLGLQFDIYHAAMMDEPVAENLSRFLPYIRHIQLADKPGRHHPGSGTLDFPYLFSHLQRLGYTGHIGLEYFPSDKTHACFNWMKNLPPSSIDRNLR